MIGAAVSTDLFTWTRVAVNHCPGTSGQGGVYACDEAWTTWGGPPDAYNQHCRDPFVLRDPATGTWWLFATARSTNRFGVVTVARSTDLLAWVGAGWIDATRRRVDGTGAQRTGGQCENPFVLEHDGAWLLLFTDWEDPEDSVGVPSPRTQVQYATSATLAVDPSGSPGWVYRGYTPDPSVNAIEVFRPDGGAWVMSQRIANRRHARRSARASLGGRGRPAGSQLPLRRGRRPGRRTRASIARGGRARGAADARARARRSQPVSHRHARVVSQGGAGALRRFALASGGMRGYNIRSPN